VKIRNTPPRDAGIYSQEFPHCLLYFDLVQDVFNDIAMVIGTWRVVFGVVIGHMA